MRLALIALVGMASLVGVSAQTSFCDEHFPPIMNEGSVQTTQAYQLTQFLQTAAQGGAPRIPSCMLARRLLAVGPDQCSSITGFFQRESLLPFFNGSNPGWRNPAENTPTMGNDLPDYITDGGAAEALVDRLTAYFGQEGVLNCSMDTDFPAYTGRDNQHTVHANMPIGEEAYNDFVSAITDTASSYGLPDAKIVPLSALLNFFKRHTPSPDTDPTTICNQDDCPCSANAEGGADCKVAESSSSTGDDGGAASTVSVSFLAMAVAAVAALVRA